VGAIKTESWAPSYRIGWARWLESALGQGARVQARFDGVARRSFSDAIILNRLPCPGGLRYIGDMIDAETCEAAMKKRDSSFDGLFFVGVKTTGIYCRPVCTARMPRRENIQFYPSAASAERAGYRPCLRCRPETAPFCPAWKGTRTTVERALRMIEDGALDQGGVEELAERLGIGSRHLSRLFDQHINASPLQVAKTLRVQKAKRLLDTTKLSIVDIASQAGFSNTRRMTAAFSDLYGRSPSELRRTRPPGPADAPRQSRSQPGRLTP
jgi:AraC family transcriptional regulator of adaptative response / DNA-3-methyladenine glycosylase II